MSFLFNRIFGTYGEGQYVGDEASEWFSNYLNKPGFRLYKLSKPRLVIESKDGADCARPDDKVGEESLHVCCVWVPCVIGAFIESRDQVVCTLSTVESFKRHFFVFSFGNVSKTMTSKVLFLVTFFFGYKWKAGKNRKKILTKKDSYGQAMQVRFKNATCGQKNIFKLK